MNGCRPWCIIVWHQGWAILVKRLLVLFLHMLCCWEWKPGLLPHCGFPGQTNTGIRKLQGSILVEKGLVMPEVSFRQLWMGRNVLNI